MKDEQYLFIFNKAKKYLVGTPDPMGYRKEVGRIWEKIKAKSQNEEEQEEAFKLIAHFLRIIDAAYKEGVEL